MTEPRDIRLKRLHMRSMRRGIREMDLILSGFASRALAAMGGEDLDAYESLLSENDQDLYAWVNGQSPAPARHAPLVARIAEDARRAARSAHRDVLS